VSDVRIIIDRDSGRPKGFGFVTFVKPSDADAAISDLNGQDIMGRQVRVDKAGPRGAGPRGGGGGGGGGGGYNLSDYSIVISIRINYISIPHLSLRSS
jgi:cold-inducible RNA-binding protein